LQRLSTPLQRFLRHLPLFLFAASLKPLMAGYARVRHTPKIFWQASESDHPMRAYIFQQYRKTDFYTTS
jgi:hypothetical protein